MVNLTEDWLYRRLPEGSYFIQTEKGILVAYCDEYEFYVGNKRLFHTEIEEVLDPCDYKELESLRGIASKTEFYQKACNLWIDKSDRLIKLIKECKPYVDECFARLTTAENYDKLEWKKLLQILENIEKELE